MGKVMSTI